MARVFLLELTFMPSPVLCAVASCRSLCEPPSAAGRSFSGTRRDALNSEYNHRSLEVGLMLSGKRFP